MKEIEAVFFYFIKRLREIVSAYAEVMVSKKDHKRAKRVRRRRERRRQEEEGEGHEDQARWCPSWWWRPDEKKDTFDWFSQYS